MPGEQVIQGHPDAIQILLRGRAFAVEGFRGDKARRARQQVRAILGKPGAVGQAEVQHAQFAVFPQQQVFRLDVTVQDLPAVQHPDGTQQALGQGLPLRQGQWALVLEQLSQGLPGVFTHHVVQMLATNGRMDFRKRAAGDPTQEPFLRQQCLGGEYVIVVADRQGLQQPRLLLGIAYPVEQGLTTLPQQRFHLPAFEALPDFQGRRQRPLLQLHQCITQGGSAELVDAHQQGTGIVLAARQMRGADQGVDREGQVRLFPQDCADAVVIQGCPYAVAEQ